MSSAADSVNSDKRVPFAEGWISIAREASRDVFLLRDSIRRIRRHKSHANWTNVEKLLSAGATICRTVKWISEGRLQCSDAKKTGLRNETRNCVKWFTLVGRVVSETVRLSSFVTHWQFTQHYLSHWCVSSVSFFLQFQKFQFQNFLKFNVFNFAVQFSPIAFTLQRAPKHTTYFFLK